MCCFQFHSIVQLFCKFIFPGKDRPFHSPIGRTSTHKWKPTHRRGHLFIICFSLWFISVFIRLFFFKLSIASVNIKFVLRWLIVSLSRQNTPGDLYILGLLVVNPGLALVVVQLYGRNWILCHFWVLSGLRSRIDVGIGGHCIPNRILNLLEPLHSFRCASWLDSDSLALHEVEGGAYPLTLPWNWVLVRMLFLTDKSFGWNWSTTSVEQYLGRSCLTIATTEKISRHLSMFWLSKNLVGLSCGRLTLLEQLWFWVGLPDEHSPYDLQIFLIIEQLKVRGLVPDGARGGDRACLPRHWNRYIVRCGIFTERRWLRLFNCWRFRY